MKLSRDFESKNRKRKQTLQITLSGVIYLLRTGCQWRMLPEEVYGKWELVYYYYRRWMACSVLEALLYKLVTKIRRQNGKTAEPSAIDTQSIRSAADVCRSSAKSGLK